MRRSFSLFFAALTLGITASAQVDTTFIYNSNMPYGTLDIRLARSASWYFYLQENQTFSFRGTGTFLDMTYWDSSPYTQGNLRERNGNNDAFVLNYRLLPPVGYNASYSPGYPLILVMHGLGESGNCFEHTCYHASKDYSPVTNDPPAPTDPGFELLNNDHQLTNGGNTHLWSVNKAGTQLPDAPGLDSRAFPGFVLFPQNLKGWDSGNVQDVIRLVRLLCKRYNIDENRIYIHGLSNGGAGVFETIKRAPWMFAAALTMSAINDAGINSQGVAPSIAHIPLWMFQGGLDENPYPHKTENYIKQFRDAGAVVRYTKYDNLGHGTWATAYSEPDFFTWMLGKNKANIHVSGGNPTICGPGLKLELPAGYRAYQWQLNGQTIPGATAATHMATSPGTYRARFSRFPNPSEGQWNQWSNAVEVQTGQGLPQAEIIQHGTVLLRDLNNYPNARLEAKGDYAHYYWYKDGARVDFPGDQDDTVKRPIITPTMGKGIYTLVTSNFSNCSSPVSAGKSLFFNNAAPINITAPSNLQGSGATASGVTLSWTDASSNEGGFEIWRRRKIDAGSWDIWRMATLTGPNMNTFTDTGLLPTTTYQYTIRAVSNTGRSNYTPSSGGIELTTGADTEAPTAPEGFVVSSVGISKLLLKWRPSTDNAGVKNYVITYGTETVTTENADTSLLLTDLPVNNVFVFTVKASDFAGNLSAPSNEKKGYTYVAGLFYEHSTKATPILDSVNWDRPEFTGFVKTFTLAPKTQEDYFNFRYEGFLFITTGGAYEFKIGSDDGTRLRLKNNVIIDNDGIHTFRMKASTPQNLEAGAHRIGADFFDFTESDSLLVQYKGPDTNNEWVEIPETVLKSAEHVITGSGPDDGPEDSFILSIFPNPSTQDNIRVQLQSLNTAPVHVQLMDMVGRSYVTETIDPMILAEGITLAPAERLVTGVYLVVVRQGKLTARQRVIVKD